MASSGISRESAEMQKAMSAVAGRSWYLGRARNRSTESFEYLAPVCLHSPQETPDLA